MGSQAAPPPPPPSRRQQQESGEEAAQRAEKERRAAALFGGGGGAQHSPAPLRRPLHRVSPTKLPGCALYGICQSTRRSRSACEAMAKAPQGSLGAFCNLWPCVDSALEGAIVLGRWPHP